MKENINCVSYPFREGDGPAFPTVYFHEGPMLAEDIFLADERVSMRSLEYIDLRELSSSTMPSGGFSVKKWVERGRDGTERLAHYHIELLPEFDREARKFIDQRLMSFERSERIDKAYALSGELPRLIICPDNMIALANNSTPFMAIDGAGTVMNNKNRLLSMWPDKENGIPYFRFGVYTSDIIDSATEEEYRIIASGRIIAEGHEVLKERLDSLMSNQKINPKALSQIARLAISISPK